jgi:cGMP-dependent protein kinase
VLIFELCGGLPPFYEEDKLAMYQRIVHVKYAAPAHFSKVGG